MKKLTLALCNEYPITPVTTWVHGFLVKREPTTPFGQFRRPTSQINPYFHSRKLWCELSLELDGVHLHFATPDELDHVREILGRKVIPSGYSLLPETPSWMKLKGRPKHHWLSVLPAKAKTWKFRQKFHLATRGDVAEIREFRKFYLTGWAVPKQVWFEEAKNASV